MTMTVRDRDEYSAQERLLAHYIDCVIDELEGYKMMKKRLDETPALVPFENATVKDLREIDEQWGVTRKFKKLQELEKEVGIR